MKISKYKIAWFLTSILISIVVSRSAYLSPQKFSPLVDLLATIVSILIGISLAISAIFASGAAIGQNQYTSELEHQRIQKILQKDDLFLIEGQNIIFWFYYLTLVLAVIFKWLTASAGNSDLQVYDDLYVKIFSACFALVSTMALLWSVTLPSILRSISVQRKNLN